MDDRKTVQGRPLVLVVEDETLLRLAVAEMLEDAGYRVIEAASSAEAIRYLETERDIRIVYTDIDMRGSASVTLAAAIRDRWPPVELILSSGAPPPPVDQLPERGVFLSKPFSERQLNMALSRFADIVPQGRH